MRQWRIILHHEDPDVRNVTNQPGLEEIVEKTVLNQEYQIEVLNHEFKTQEEANIDDTTENSKPFRPQDWNLSSPYCIDIEILGSKLKCKAGMYHS